MKNPKVVRLKLKVAFSFLIVLNFLTIGFGQRIPRNVPTNNYPNQPIPGTEFGNPEEVLDSIREEVQRDSFVASYFLISDVFKKFKLKDTASTTSNMWYDKAGNPHHLRGNLGNNGSPSFSLVFTPGHSTGFNTGFRQYEQYKIHQDSFQFYNSNRPMADLNFSPIWGNQQNFAVGATFARSFSDGVALSTTFARINQEGFYTNSFTRGTNLGIAIRKEWTNSRITSFVSMTSNVHDDRINGGVTTDSLYNKPNYNFRTRIPVFLSGAAQRYDEKSISLINLYRLGDSLASENDIYLRHSISYDYEKYKFFDSTSENRMDFYGEGFAFDERGLRMFFGVNKIKNNFSISGQYKNKYRGTLGILHELITIRNDIDRSLRNDLTAFANGEIVLSKIFQINLNGRLGLGSNVGKFDFNGNSTVNIGKWAALNFGARLYNLETPYIYSNLNVNGRNILNNQRLNQAGISLFGHLDVPLTKTRISITQNVVDNIIFWDSLALPILVDGAFIHAVAKIDQRFKWRFLHSEHFAVYQTFSSPLARLPNWYSYHNLYWRGRLFKKILDLKLGGEHFFVPSFSGLDYSPVTGQFINRGPDIPFFSQTNLFLQGKVSNFHIFVKVENLQHYIEGRVQYQTGTYPQLDGRIRIGLRWLLLD